MEDNLGKMIGSGIKGKMKAGGGKKKKSTENESRSKSNNKSKITSIADAGNAVLSDLKIKKKKDKKDKTDDNEDLGITKRSKEDKKQDKKKKEQKDKKAVEIFSENDDKNMPNILSDETKGEKVVPGKDVNKSQEQPMAYALSPKDTKEGSNFNIPDCTDEQMLSNKKKGNNKKGLSSKHESSIHDEVDHEPSKAEILASKQSL